MNVALRRPMTRDEFFVWAEAREGRHEFDGFQPVAMTGGSLGHSRIIGNINRQLGNRLAGKSCSSMGPEAGVATIGNAVRYPDAVVTCSAFDNRSHLVPNPVVVFEVVSPSSIGTDRVTKLAEYGAVPSIRRYLIVEQVTAAVAIYVRERGDEAFKADGAAGNDILALPEIGIELPLADIYEGIPFDVEQET